MLFPLFITSCGEDINSEGEYDDIAKTLTLDKNYEGKDFHKDGIGKAILTKPTDGDTANFKLENGLDVVVRFFGIDTPESTGGVEKWGKAASLFVKTKLQNATEIVLEASTTPASKDSYGTRYLAYVWYKDAENQAFKNLCLELVENGFTDNKCINTKEFIYYSYFKKADDFAKKYSLRVKGNDKDPLYSNAAKKITIKEFRDNTDLYYNKEADSGAKVRIQAYISDVKISSTSTYTFVAEEIVDGVKYTLDVYTGYSSSLVAQNMKVGYKYSITGSISVHNGAFQLSGITFVAMQSGGDYLTVVQRDYLLTFDSSKDYVAYYGTTLYNDASITSCKEENGNIILTGTSKNKSQRAEGEEKIFTFIIPMPEEEIDVQSLIGKNIKLRGFQYEKDSKVINVLSYNDIFVK